MEMEQAASLAAIERAHGQVVRVPDDSPAGTVLLSDEVTGTRCYQCQACETYFTVEPDGTAVPWCFEPGVD